MLTQRRIYEFDDFRVDTGQFVLTKAGHTQAISPTVFRILILFLERAGEVIGKDDLMKYVWPDSFVEEGNLNRNVSTLRKALDEKPSDHRYIETIPKVGYRFIAPVRIIEYQPPAGAPRAAASRSASHVVGREAERDMLSQAYAQARQGHGGLVCISGDAGLGKTALVDAFVEDLVRDGQTFHLARGRCSESFTEAEPLMPWIESLSTLGEEPAIKAALKSAAPSWYGEISHTQSGNPQKMNRELLDFCRQVSSVHPLIVVIDDFHWADLSSVDLLAFLATRLESVRVLVIVCYRLPEMKIKAHPFLRLRSDLLGRGICTELRLSPLTAVQVGQYLALENGNSAPSPEYIEQMYSKSEGNPQFMRELLNGQDRLSKSVHYMVQSKLDQLHDTHRQLLVTASVQGREFDSAVVAATAQAESVDIEEALSELDEVYGLIHRIREEELPDGRSTVRYRFVYGLYQEACYASLAPTRKATLSASLAQAFLTYYGN